MILRSLNLLQGTSIDRLAFAVVFYVAIRPALVPKRVAPATAIAASRAQGDRIPRSPADSIGAEVHLAAAPHLVGPGVISTPAEEFKATVSPDGQTLLYTITDHQFSDMTILQSRRVGEDWGVPDVVPFSGIWNDGDPSFAPDGRSALFISDRPMPGDTTATIRRDFNIWTVRREADGAWGAPSALGRDINTDGSKFAPSVTTSGKLYFSRGHQIFVAVKSAAGFQTPVALPFPGRNPAISADERFLVFDRDHAPGDADLFVSCYESGRWSAPARFAAPVNSLAEEGDPSISSDGRTLYFFSTRLAAAADRPPRAARATYTEIQREVGEMFYNGSRNLYQVDISSLHCPLADR